MMLRVWYTLPVQVTFSRKLSTSLQYSAGYLL